MPTVPTDQNRVSPGALPTVRSTVRHDPDAYGASVGQAVAGLARPVLAYAQRASVSPGIVWGWLSYMIAVSAVRLLMVRRYRRDASPEADDNRWRTAFAAGAALAAAGWAAAAVVLYVPARPMNEAFLVFVVGFVYVLASLASRNDQNIEADLDARRLRLKVHVNPSAQGRDATPPPAQVDGAPSGASEKAS